MAKQPQQPQRRPGQPAPAQTRKPATPPPAPARRTAEIKENVFSAGSRELLYGRQNYLYMGAGLGLILLGLLAMAGGSMPDPKVWEPERIYSFQRITLAPLMMVAGFVVVAIGIFKKNGTSSDAATEAPPAE
jgi:hypothetical protein